MDEKKLDDILRETKKTNKLIEDVVMTFNTCTVIICMIFVIKSVKRSL